MRTILIVSTSLFASWLTAADDVRVNLLPGTSDKIMVSAPSGSSPDAFTQAQLRQRISCDFKEAELSEVIHFFRRVSDVNFVIDPKLRVAPVSFTASDMSLGTALTWVEKLSGCKLSYINQAIYVSDKRHHSQRTVKIYDVAELTAGITDFPGPKQSLEAQQVQFTGINDLQENKARAIEGQDLVEIIEQHVTK